MGSTFFFCPSCNQNFKSDEKTETYCPYCMRKTNLIIGESEKRKEKKKGTYIFVLFFISLLLILVTYFFLHRADVQKTQKIFTEESKKKEFQFLFGENKKVREYFNKNIKSKNIFDHIKALLEEKKINIISYEFPVKMPQGADDIAESLLRGENIEISYIELALFLRGLLFAGKKECKILEIPSKKNGSTSILGKKFGFKCSGEEFFLDHNEIKKNIKDEELFSYFLALKSLFFWMRGERRKAYQLLDSSMRLNPQNVAIRFLMGKFKVSSGLVEYGLMDMEYAITKSPDPEGYYNYAISLMKEENPLKAISNLRNALEIDENYLPAISMLGRLLLQKMKFSDDEKRKEIEKEIGNLLHRAMKIDKNSIDTILFNADFNIANGKIDEGIKILKEKEEDVVIGRYLAGIYLVNNEKEKAMEVLERIWKNHPEDIEISLMLYTNMLSDGKRDEAIKIKEKVLEISKNDPEIIKLFQTVDEKFK